MTRFFTLLRFLQTLTNCCNIWHLVYRVNLQHNSYWFPCLSASAYLCTSDDQATAAL